MTHPIVIAALLPLPEAVQAYLSNLNDVDINRALAASAHVTPAVASALASSGDITTSLRALSKCDDVDLARTALRTEGLKAAHAAKNPFLTEEDLVPVLDHANNNARLAAYCHKNTPLENRRSKLSKLAAHVIVNVAPTAAGDVIRGYELALANPWMLEKAGQWSLPVHRGLTTLPEMTLEHYAAMKNSGYARWDSMKNHPALSGMDASSATPLELIEAGSCATDMMALKHPLLEAAHVPHFASKSRREPEPHVLARVVDAFGPSLMTSESQRDPFSQTAYRAAGWSSHAVAYSNTFSHAMYSAVKDAAAVLGDDCTAWGLFASLPVSHIKDYGDLAEAAVLLAGK